MKMTKSKCGYKLLLGENGSKGQVVIKGRYKGYVHAFYGAKENLSVYKMASFLYPSSEKKISFIKSQNFKKISEYSPLGYLRMQYKGKDGFAKFKSKYSSPHTKGIVRITKQLLSDIGENALKDILKTEALENKDFKGISKDGFVMLREEVTEQNTLFIKNKLDAENEKSFLDSNSLFQKDSFKSILSSLTKEDKVIATKVLAPLMGFNVLKVDSSDNITISKIAKESFEVTKREGKFFCKNGHVEKELVIFKTKDTKETETTVWEFFKENFNSPEKKELLYENVKDLFQKKEQDIKIALTKDAIESRPEAKLKTFVQRMLGLNITTSVVGLSGQGRVGKGYDFASGEKIDLKAIIDSKYGKTDEGKLAFLRTLLDSDKVISNLNAILAQKNQYGLEKESGTAILRPLFVDFRETDKNKELIGLFDLKKVLDFMGKEDLKNIIKKELCFDKENEVVLKESKSNCVFLGKDSPTIKIDLKDGVDAFSGIVFKDKKKINFAKEIHEFFNGDIGKNLALTALVSNIDLEKYGIDIASINTFVKDNFFGSKKEISKKDVIMGDMDLTQSDLKESQKKGLCPLC